MVNLAARRQEVAAALDAVTGLRQVQSEGLAPDKLNLPTCVVVVADTATPMNLTLTETYEHLDVVLIHSLKGGITRSQRSLDDLYADVYGALVDIPSLLSIERRGYGVIEVLGVEVLGAILRLEVIDQ